MGSYIAQDMKGAVDDVSEHVDTYLATVKTPHRRERVMRFYFVDSCEECPYLNVLSFGVRRCRLRDVIVDDDGIACEHNMPKDPCEFKGTFGIFKVIE